MMKNLIYPLISVWFLMAMACNDEETTPVDETTDLHLVTEQGLTQIDLDLEVYSNNDELHTGYNRLIFQLLRSGTDERYENASITLSPLMDMGDMMHAAPVENPEYLADKNHFEGAVVFVMPSTAGNWSLTVSVHNNEINESASIEIPINVSMPNESRMLSFIHDNEKYFLSLIEPSTPIVGINDFEIVVHRKETMMSWPYVDDFEFEIIPEMPTMGHGSPNNINPVHSTLGHYLGKVNFTMDGYWKINLNASINGEQIDEDLSFDITFSAKSNQ